MWLTNVAMVRAKLLIHAPDRPTSAKAILSPTTTSFRLADITGQSLPTLEGSDFAWSDNACSLCHFPLPCTSPKQLDVNCDVVFFCAQFFAAKHDSVVRRRCRLK